MLLVKCFIFLFAKGKGMKFRPLHNFIDMLYKFWPDRWYRSIFVVD